MSCERKPADDHFSPVKNALNGNFVLVKPKECHPPEQDSWTQRTDEMLLNTSAFGSDSDLDGYDTAPSEHSEVEDVYEDCCTPTEQVLNSDRHPANERTTVIIKPQNSEKFNSIETRKLTTDRTPSKAAEVSTKPVTIPERTATDHFFFRNQWGKLKRFYSTLHWVQATADKNKETCFDCAAQISTRDVSSTEMTSVGDSSKSLQGDNFQFERSIKSAYTTPRSRGCLSTNFTTTADDYLECEKTMGEESCMDKRSNSAMIEAIDNLIIRLEQFMRHKYEHLAKPENPDQQRQSMLNKPLGELSPQSKNEVHNLLQEAADSMDVSGIDIDDSHSSIELVWSMVREAGKRFGFGEEDWPKKLITEQSVKSRADDTIGSDESIPDSKGNNVLCSSISETKVQTFSAFLAKEQTAATPTVPLSRGSVKGEIFNFDSSSSLTSTDLSHIRKLRVSKTESAPELKKSKAVSSASSVHFDRPGKFEHGDSGRISSCTKTTQPTRTIVRRRACIAPKSEEYHTCRQVIQDNRGVKASFLPKRTRKNNKKSTNKTEKGMPQVEEFKTSTKKGAHSYFEILNTRLVMPLPTDKKVLTEATIPVPLYSEAVWKNGELLITLKELDRDLSHLSLDDKERFTRLPKSISIEFIREFKEDRLGQKSPSVIKKMMHDKTTSPTKEHQHAKKQPSPKPFNTKVDFIYKRDPMVLGTLDRDKRKVIERQKLKKSRVPAFCVV